MHPAHTRGRGVSSVVNRSRMVPDFPRTCAIMGDRGTFRAIFAAAGRRFDVSDRGHPVGRTPFPLFRGQPLARSEGTEIGEGKRGHDRAANTPRVEARPPHDRHYLDRIKGTSRVKEHNTVILPGVDGPAETALINAGEAIRDGDRYAINNRVWRQKPDGLLIPEAGDGLMYAGRETYRALTVFARFGGPTEAAMTQIENSPSITDHDRDEALRIWKHRTK